MTVMTKSAALNLDRKLGRAGERKSRKWRATNEFPIIFMRQIFRSMSDARASGCNVEGVSLGQVFWGGGRGFKRDDIEEEKTWTKFEHIQ